MARDGTGGEKGRGVICSRGHARKYTFPIPFCMIPHRGRTSTRLVGTGAAERSFEEKTAFSADSSRSNRWYSRERTATSRKKGIETGLFLCRKLTEELWSAGSSSRLSWSIDDRHVGR